MSDCQIEEGSLWYALLQSRNATLPTLSSELAVTNSMSTVIISGLNKKSVYNLTIIFNSSVVIAFSESQQFCKC